MVDLGSSKKAAREGAFALVLPTIFRSVDGLFYLFEDDLSDSALLKHYRSLVDKTLETELYYDINTVFQLHTKLKSALGRLKNEVPKGTPLQTRVTKVIGFVEQEKQEMTLSATSVSVAEAQDVAGLGRKMTTTESHSMKKMRTHKLWGDFVEDVRMLSANGAKTSDFVEVQLLCGIPYVRKQLYCEVSVGATAGEPWDLLMDYRFASKVNLEQDQIYLGRELVRGEDGAAPEKHAYVKAPSLPVRQLKEGAISKINWEQVWAEMMCLMSEPVPAVAVQSFTDDARYTNGEYEHEIKQVGGAALRAWGYNDSDVRKGSFEQLVDDHFRDIRSVRH